MSAKTRVLVVDDEPAIIRFLKPALEANDYDLTSTGTVADAMKRIASSPPDIVVLDLGLPDGDGKDVIRQVRQWSDVPIIVLSARDRETEKIAALRHRMQRNAETPVAVIGPLEIDNLRHRVLRKGQEVRLTPKEFELLSFLSRHAGKVLTHRQIMTAVWGPAHTEDTQYLRVYVGHLRQKLEDAPDDPQLILTESGIGYRLHVES
jgi:two-component system KDP operon response regulator KdpE